MEIWDDNQKDRDMRFVNEQDFYNCEHSEQRFIDDLQGKACLVQVYLIGGQKILGRILGSDEYTILLSRQRSGNQLVYKAAITTISIFEDKKNGQ